MILSVVNHEEHLLTYDTPKPHYQIPKYPIVLCHGFSGFDHLFQLPMFSTLPPLTDKFKNLFNKKIQSSSSAATSSASQLSNNETVQNMGIDNKSLINNSNTKYLIEYWNGIKKNLQVHGCNVLIAKVPPFASIETRASILDKFLINSLPYIRENNKHLPTNKPIKINLIAHSMGGLDCRYLIHQNEKFPNNHYEIVSLTTISTPHRGTSIANFLINSLPNYLIENYFPSIFQLTTNYAKNFNTKIIDNPNVKYFSYGAKMNPDPTSMFLITWKIINDIEGPNDGMVSLKSCKWGEFKGFLDDVDHADLINWMGILKKTKLALGISNFNPNYFYLDIINNLAINNL
ncbi:hypothetical protein C6P40_004028 [Pichia californica]|uniref:DUF676 domain-containing protein n=1 Tax=Pichia californica TaxID=460514 RepID=A0A9P7BHE4_9ASCO|nr:hypothetical protein C6P42_002434 [[Candida] californica]KAG0691216.1 hypothetical protein C6P40_004028 [[Candida] californica]